MDISSLGGYGYMPVRTDGRANKASKDEAELHPPLPSPPPASRMQPPTEGVAGPPLPPPADDAPEITLVEEDTRTLSQKIVDLGGFQAYADKVREEKLEEIRREILERMGLTEEMLAELPADARAVIEDLIATEIQRRMMASNEVDDSEKKKGGLSEATPTGLSVSLIASDQGTKSGMGVLLALQEIDTQRAEDAGMDEPDSLAKNERDKPTV